MDNGLPATHVVAALKQARGRQCGRLGQQTQLGKPVRISRLRVLCPDHYPCQVRLGGMARKTAPGLEAETIRELALGTLHDDHTAYPCLQSVRAVERKCPRALGGSKLSRNLIRPGITQPPIPQCVAGIGSREVVGLAALVLRQILVKPPHSARVCVCIVVGKSALFP
jgi:hypothetical protein